MSTGFSKDDLLDFLERLGARGVIPSATATALQVATRNILGVLSPEEQADLTGIKADAVIKRFHNKRAKDFSPGSLKEYGRRFSRAIALFEDWRRDPANFSVKTRSTTSSGSRRGTGRTAAATGPGPAEDSAPVGDGGTVGEGNEGSSGGYRTAFPVRAGVVVGISNLPADLSKTEAEKLAQFIRLLAVE